MFLKSIRLINFVCFSDLAVAFQQKDGSLRKWTLLTGENGTGKSAILRAIGLLTASDEVLADLLGNPSSWIKLGADHCEISATLTTAESETQTVVLRIKRGDTPEDVVSRAQTINPGLFVTGYGASRRLSNGLDKTLPAPDAQSVATLFDANAALLMPEAWTGNEERDHAVFGQILGTFLPDVTFERVNKRGELCFATVDGIIPLRRLGDSYQSAAAWISDFMQQATQRFDDLPSPLDAPGLLLIDAVDLHMHPAWQQRLLSTLDEQLPNVQIVATTQSAITAQQAGPDEIHSLTRGQAGVVVEQFTADPRRLLVSQLLLSNAFGLDSDESFIVQQKKAIYRELVARLDRSADDDRELETLTGELNEIPSGGRTNLTLQHDQLELLGEILQDLKARQS